MILFNLYTLVLFQVSCWPSINLKCCSLPVKINNASQHVSVDWWAHMSNSYSQIIQIHYLECKLDALTYPRNQKSSGIMSGDRSGQSNSKWRLTVYNSVLEIFLQKQFHHFSDARWRPIARNRYRNYTCGFQERNTMRFQYFKIRSRDDSSTKKIYDDGITIK